MALAIKFYGYIPPLPGEPSSSQAASTAAKLDAWAEEVDEVAPSGAAECDVYSMVTTGVDAPERNRMGYTYIYIYPKRRNFEKQQYAAPFPPDQKARRYIMALAIAGGLSDVVAREDCILFDVVAREDSLSSRPGREAAVTLASKGDCIYS